MDSFADVNERIGRVKEMLRPQTDQLQANQLKQVLSLHNVSAVLDEDPHHR